MTFFSSKMFRWIVVGVVGAAVVTAAALVMLRNLSAPPPVYQDVYNINLGGVAKVDLDSATDHLLVLPDETVQVYIPQGSYSQGGSMVMLPHATDFIPQVLEEHTLRLLAADIFIVSTDGEIRSSANLQRSILICFSLDSEQRRLSREEGYDFAVERYDESLDPPGWVGLPESPGWMDGQVCAATDHLSLYALTVTFPLDSTLPTPTPDSKGIEPAAEDELYGIPTIEPEGEGR